jgi:hypothetical protein
MLTGFDLCRAALAVEGISAPEQSVLNVLAIMANKQAQCWPPINGSTGLTGKTKLSERAVQNAIKALASGGHISREERAGRGVTYTVHPRTGCTPAQDAPPQDGRPAGPAPTPAQDAPKQPRTTKPQKASPSSGRRATTLPPNFQPIMREGSETAKVTAGWTAAEAKAQFEHFTDHHTAKGTRSLDWQATWRTWVARSKQFSSRHSASSPRGERYRDPLLRDLADREAGLRAMGVGDGFLPDPEPAVDGGELQRIPT